MMQTPHDSQPNTVTQHDARAVFAAHAGNVRRLALRLLRREDLADDVLQDVFLTWWQSRDKWDADGPARLSTWLYRVTVFKCADKRRQFLPVVNSDISDFSDILPAIETAAPASLDTLKRLLGGLSDQQRQALQLHYMAGQDVRSIANTLQTTEDGVRSLLKRGKQKLRDSLPGEIDDYL
jgi:RNA polymerase sigma-70 factor (ECF subfamily)